MRAKTINEVNNFERHQDPKKAMGIGYGDKLSEKMVEEHLINVFFKYSESTGGADMQSFGDWLAEEIKELFRGATYGDYPEEDAQKDYNHFLVTFKRSLNKPLF